MPLPRWTLAAVATALVVPIAGPAFATAVTDPDVSLGEALLRIGSGPDDPCEAPDEPAPHAPAPEEPEPDEPEPEEPAPDEPAPEEPAPDAPAPDDPDCPDEDQTPGADEPQDGEDAADPTPADEGTDPEVEEIGAAPEGGDDGEDRTVALIARCAPRGPDVEADWGLRNHGAFVRAAAQREELTVHGEAYDLSTIEGARALCDTIAAGPPEPQDAAAEEADGAVTAPREGTPPGHARRAGEDARAKHGQDGPPGNGVVRRGNGHSRGGPEPGAG